jgi:hypothetical protein
MKTCVSTVIVSALELAENAMRLNINPTDTSPSVQLSRAFAHYNECIQVNPTPKPKDVSSMVLESLMLVARLGVCSEAAWPSDQASINAQPNADAYADAANHRVSMFARVYLSDLNSVKRILASGMPIIFGFKAPQEFNYAQTALNGVIQMPTADQVFAGGYVALIVGYQDSTETFLVRNSWGPDWGINGYCAIPYAYVADTSLVSDAWVIKN